MIGANFPRGKYGKRLLALAVACCLALLPARFYAAPEGAVRPETRYPGEYRTVLRGNKSDTVTVMVYMCGSDLERRGGFATSDLREMMRANLGEKVNLLVLTGGTVRWKNNIMSGEKTQLWRIQGQQIHLLQDFEKTDMTHPDTLRDFVKLAAQKAPADRYALILWDHGAGTVGGFGYDENFRTSPSMGIEEMDTALEQSGVVFDFVGFDACLMATMETALVMERHADYMIASQMLEPGGGWNYTRWLTALNENTSIETPELAKIIADSFVEVCTPVEKQNGVTLSAIDLTRIGGLLRELDGFSMKHTGLLYNEEGYTRISQARSNSAIQYSKDEADLGVLARSIDPEAAAAIRQALDDCIIYNRATIGDRNGLNVYFPYSSLQKLDAAMQLYEKIHMSRSYTDLIRIFSSIMAGGQQHYADSTPASDNRRLAPETPEDGYRWLDASAVETYAGYYAASSEDLSFLDIVEENGSYKLIMPEEVWDAVTAVELQVVIDKKDRYLDLGSDGLYEFDKDGNLVIDYNNHWVALNGIVVFFEMRYEYTEGEQFYSTGVVPVAINGEQAELVLIWDNDHPKGYVAGVRYMYEDQEQKGLFGLADGDRLEFSCDSYNTEWEYMGPEPMGSLTVRGALDVDYRDIGADDCFVYYMLTDIYGNRYWTEPLVFEAE